ncbi:MAG: radical SAM protein [Candidatus Coatesbacteria bacterium]|nr:MAG: radical SAM protein [Candidatus Coatesbacteria bacterium]
MARRNGDPVDAVVALCYRCNLQCVTCDLASRGPEALSPETLRKLPPSLAYVNVTGGEPLLLDDLVPGVRAIYEATGAEITLSTNGTLPERTEEVVRDLRRDVEGLRVAVSIDGLEATHDHIRQAPGAFRKALATVERLHPLLGGDLHLAFTISAANAAEFDGVASLAREYRLPLSLALTHTSEHYFRPQAEAVPAKEEALTAVDAATRYYLREFSPQAAGRAYFAAGLATVVATGRRPLPCRAGDRFFYLDPRGEVYLCNMRVETLGSLERASFEEIWERRRRRELLPTTGPACPIQCWMVCTARTSIQDSRLRAAAWAALAYLSTWCGGAPPRP